MLKRTAWGLVGAFSLMAVIGSDVALADGAVANGRSGIGDDSSLSAFLASPVFTRVAPQVQSTIAAGPIFAPRVGLFCQTMTQTIDIDGQSVHASALLCRQPDGTWRISPPQDAKGAAPARRSAPSSRGSAIATVD